MAGSSRAGQVGRRSAFVAGIAGAAATTAAMAALHTFAPHVPFLPQAIAQTVVRTAPGGLATFLIERLGHWALRLAVGGTAVGFLLGGGAAALAVPWIRKRLPAPARRTSLPAGAIAFLALWLGSVASYLERAGSIGRLAFAVASLPVFALGGLVSGGVLDRLTGERAPGWLALPRRWQALAESPRLASAEPLVPPPGLARRYVLRAAWLGTLGVLLGAADLGRVLYRRPDPGTGMLRVAAAAPPPPPPDPSFDRVPGLTPEVTALRDFYVVDEEIIDPDVDPATWRLTVAGHVERPARLSYEDLKGMPIVERYQTLECISNPIGGDLMSTALWAGVPLHEVLARAGARPETVEVVFTCAGGYSDSLPIDRAMDPATLLAIGMNGHVLPRAHGFPARVLSLGTYGMKNPKWVERIDAVVTPYAGYWEQRGWAKLASVRTTSRIDTPRSGETVTGAVDVAGVAFAGDRGISRVEVSADQGRTWSAAELRAPLAQATWVQWRHRVPAGPRGRTVLVVRATDGGGELQSGTVRSEHPSGASGYHAISIERA